MGFFESTYNPMSQNYQQTQNYQFYPQNYQSFQQYQAPQETFQSSSQQYQLQPHNFQPRLENDQILAQITPENNPTQSFNNQFYQFQAQNIQTTTPTVQTTTPSLQNSQMPIQNSQFTAQNFQTGYQSNQISLEMLPQSLQSQPQNFPKTSDTSQSLNLNYQSPSQYIPMFPPNKIPNMQPPSQIIQSSFDNGQNFQYNQQYSYMPPQNYIVPPNLLFPSPSMGMNNGHMMPTVQQQDMHGNFRAERRMYDPIMKQTLMSKLRLDSLNENQKYDKDGKPLHALKIKRMKKFRQLIKGQINLDDFLDHKTQRSSKSKMFFYNNFKLFLKF